MTLAFTSLLGINGNLPKPPTDTKIMCKVENGVVVDRIVCLRDKNFNSTGLWIENDEAQIKWTYDGVKFTPPTGRNLSEVYNEPDLVENKLRELTSKISLLEQKLNSITKV